MISESKSESNSASSSSSSSATEEPKIYESFDEMDLPDNVLRGIYSFGFDKPSSIQRRATVPLKNGRDTLAQSQSGTGKTGTFTVATIGGMDPTIKAPQTIVIAPTRELAQQIEKVALGIGQYFNKGTSEHHVGLRVLCAVGQASSVGDNKKALRQGAQFIVGTPGRIFDLIRQGALSLTHLKYLVLDEADQLLDGHFEEQIKEIMKVGAFPTSTVLGMFSATMPEEVLELAETLLNKPMRILTPPDQVRLEGIQQYHIFVDNPAWKIDALADLYKHMTVNQAIIFVNKKETAEKLSKKMSDEGYTLEYIHADMEAAERKKRMDDFRCANVRILVATDVLARGIDVQSVSTVINYEMPPNRENYFHRIGRTGRYGRKGLSINLVTADEMTMMKDIETHYSISIPPLPEDLSIIAKIGSN
jgi:translation initiation factor 4A